jgi:hypothetical protein
LVQEFIWDKNPPKVKYTCMIINIDNGGLKLQDLECKIESLKLKWICRIADPEYSALWKTYIQSKMPNMDINKCCYYNMADTDYPSFNDNFYKEMFKTWVEMHYKEPANAEEVAREIIWHNNYIKVNSRGINGRIGKNRLMFIQDLLEPSGKFATYTHLNKKYNVTIDVMTLNSIISAIPTKWKKLINSDNNIMNYKVFLDCKVDINEQSRKLIEVTTKDLYNELINRKAMRPTTENTWQEKVGLDFDESTWGLIYRNPYKITREVKIIAFHFKITHRIIACKKKSMHVEDRS